MAPIGPHFLSLLVILCGLAGTQTGGIGVYITQQKYSYFMSSPLKYRVQHDWIEQKLSYKIGFLGYSYVVEKNWKFPERRTKIL